MHTAQRDRVTISTKAGAPHLASLPPTAPSHEQRRTQDNRPTWVTRNEYEVDKSDKKRQVKKEENYATDESRNKNARLFITIGSLLVSTTSKHRAPMPLDVDNGLPGVEMRLGRDNVSELSFICHVDTCAGMSTGNLKNTNG